MTAVIIEDEKPAARRLIRMLERLDVEILDTLHSVEDSREWFLSHDHPQVIFLDIQLSDGLSFEIFESIKIRSAVIFTTAYDEYALRAFKLNSVDYLLKPIDDQELQVAVDKYKNLKDHYGPHQSEVVQLNFEDIKKLLTPALDREYKKRFTVKVGQHLKMVPSEDITCFFSENKGTYLRTEEGRNYILETTLDGLEKELCPKTFFRVNRKFFLNINFIQDIIAYSNSRLKIKLERPLTQDIIVARERVRDFKQWLE